MGCSTGRFLGFAGAALLLLSFSGCLDYDEVLTIAADGSGTMAVTLDLDLSFMAELKKTDPNPESEDATDPASFVSKKQLLQDCDVKGITVKTCDVQDKGNQKTHVSLVFDFKDLEALRAMRKMSDREISVKEAGENVELDYLFDARSLLVANGLATDDKEAQPRDERERKALRILEEARRASRAKFTLKLPGKIGDTNGARGEAQSASWKVDKSDPKAQDALLKEPLKMTATLAKKDAAFWQKEVERAKKAAEAEKKPDPAAPRPKASGAPGDE